MRNFRNTQTLLLVLVVLGSVSLVPGCINSGSQPVEFSGSALGTTYSIKIVNTSTMIAPDGLHSEIVDRLQGIDQSMSVFYDTSEISKFNQLKQARWFNISPELFQVISEAAKISALSNGAFDFTLGHLIELWGFGKALKIAKIPESAEIEMAMRASGYKDIFISGESAAIKKTNLKIALDLSAIAKGYAVDSVAMLLDERGIENYLVEIGGEIRVKGQKEIDKPWRLAIERPELGRRSIQKIVGLNSASMATSGDYRNYFEVEGKRYAHTINPKTGWPVENKIASVSVITESCIRADALATAFMVMGYEKGVQLAKEQKLAVFWILRSNQELSEKMTPEFKAYLL